ncbi:transposase [Shigella sonnei]|nr:transposase [Shigella sonnei]
MQSKPLLTSLYKLMQEKEHTLSKKCRLRDAFRYIRKHWVALCNFCDDGLAEADNNTAERALRAVCLGKKNYVFFGSDHGGERGALLYGLIGTCRLNGIDPEAYLRHILSVLPEWPSNRVDELLPWNVVLTLINKRQYGAPLTLTNYCWSGIRLCDCANDYLALSNISIDGLYTIKTDMAEYSLL